MGTVIFALPNKIMAGGITGLSTIVYYLTELNIGLALFLLNIPIFILCIFVNRELMYQSIGAMLLYSLVVGILQIALDGIDISNIYVGSIAGGLTMGVGLGLLGSANSSLGGGSLLGKMFSIKFGFSFSVCTFVIDSLVYPLSFFTIGGKETVFSIILSLFNSIGIKLMELLLDNRSLKKSKF